MRPARLWAWILAVACLDLPFGPAMAHAAQAIGSPGLCAKAQAEISIRIPPVLRMKVLREEREMPRPSPGIHDGFDRVEEAIVLEVTSNLREYGLHFEVLDPDVLDVEVEGLGATLRVGPEGAVHRVVNDTGPYGPQRHTLRYRIHYAPGASLPARAGRLRVSAQAT